ncbi:hypothetical protein BAE44_0005734, partial [Dichanthelium oligosanthes]
LSKGTSSSPRPAPSAQHSRRSRRRPRLFSPRTTALPRITGRAWAMRRSSSAARVAEGGGVNASVSEADLPTYDPLSAAGRREAARTRALARAVHCIPVVPLVCGFLLWLSASSHTHLGKFPFRLQTPLELEVLLFFPISSGA